MRGFLSKFYHGPWWSIIWIAIGIYYATIDTMDGVTIGLTVWLAVIALHSASLYRTIRTRLRPKPKLIREFMPILATRYANARFIKDTILFKSVIPGHGRFGIDEDAKCTVSGHSVPEWNCECGFYAVPADKLPRHHYNANLVLLVELSGEVIIHDEGYRAGHQRVLEAFVRVCYECERPSEVLLFGPGTGRLYDAACRTHAKEVIGKTLLTLEEASKLAGVPFRAYGNTSC